MEDERVPQIALVSQSNARNRHENTIFIKPHNFHFLFSLHGNRTVFRKRFCYRRSSRALDLWRGHGRKAFVTSWTSSDYILHFHQSIQTTSHARAKMTTDCLPVVSTPKVEGTGSSPIAECFSNFLRSEIPCDHHEG